MKIAAVKKFTQVLVAMAVAAVMAALLCAPKALGTTIGEFSIEQIYVNVPELDVFVQATDAQGQPISPDLVRAAGVELYLGDEKIPTGNIGMANEPICYVLAVDNSVDETTLKEYRIALRRLISAKGAKDQIMLYTLAGDAACVLPATIDTRAAVNAVNALESQEENEPNLVQAATIIYNDINENYQSIAPRKVIFALTEAGNGAGRERQNPAEGENAQMGQDAEGGVMADQALRIAGDGARDGRTAHPGRREQVIEGLRTRNAGNGRPGKEPARKGQ